MAGHRLAEVAPEPAANLLERLFLAVCRQSRGWPVPGYSVRSSLPDQDMAAWQFPQPAPDRVGRGDVFVKQVAGQAVQVELAPDLGMAQHRLGLGTERQAPAGQLGVEERLLPHP